MFNLSPELLAAFNEIQQPRSRYMLDCLIIGQCFTPEAQYAKCVLLAQLQWENIRLGRLDLEKLDLEIAAVTTPGRLGEIEREKKKIAKEQTQRAMLGAERELACLCEIFEQFPQKFTYAELQDSQVEEHRQRLCEQAIQDIAAFGYVTPANQDALRMIKAAIVVNEVNGKKQITIELPGETKQLEKLP